MIIQIKGIFFTYIKMWTFFPPDIQDVHLFGFAVMTSAQVVRAVCFCVLFVLFYLF